MAKGKKLFKIIKSSTSQSGDIAEMFNEMLTSSGRDPKVFVPKYRNLHLTLSRYIKLLEMLHRKLLIMFTSTPEIVLDYIQENQKILDSLAPVDGGEVYESYIALKDSSLCNSAIIACKNMTAVKAFIEDAANPNDKFLTKTAGLSFSPIEELPSLNFKQLYNDTRLGDLDKKMVLLILNKLLSIGMEVYNIMSSSDLDVDSLSEVIMMAITDVKKRIPRCDAAFDKILSAVDMLKGNFDGYYKDFVSTSNPTIIMENFVVDVARDSNPSPQLMRQFRQIIMYYQKVSQQQSTNPKFKSLFGHMNKNLEKITKMSSAKNEEEALKVMEEIESKPLEEYIDKVHDFDEEREILD